MDFWAAFLELTIWPKIDFPYWKAICMSFQSGLHMDLINTNISSVVKFQRWWVLKSKLFAQESTCSKEILIPTTLNHLSVKGLMCQSQKTEGKHLGPFLRIFEDHQWKVSHGQGRGVVPYRFSLLASKPSSTEIKTYNMDCNRPFLKHFTRCINCSAAP